MDYNIKITKTKNSKLSTLDFDNIPFGKVFSDHMFVADFINKKWTNLEIVPFGNITLSPINTALHYGQSIFEGMKATKKFDGTPVFLNPIKHAHRMAASAERMCMEPVPSNLFLKALHTLVEIDSNWIPPKQGSALYIRPFLFATDNFLGVSPSSSYKFIILTGPVGPYYSKPVKLIAQTEYIRAAPGGVGEAKTAGNYAASLLPARKAIEAGYDQVLWLDGIEKKYVQEVGTMNIFFKINDTLITPITDGAILKGITRECVIELLKHKGIKTEIRKISIYEVIEAHKNGSLKEIFGTGTAAVITHISDLNFKGINYKLPDVNKHKTAISLKEEIEGIRSGRTTDKLNWLVPLKKSLVIK